MTGIGELVDQIVVQGRGEHPALVLDDGSTLSYRNLSQRIGVAASEFAAAGLRRGQRVVLVGENSADMVVALFGAIRNGAWAVPLNARMSGAEIDAICSHCEPRLVYYASSSSDEAAAHAERRQAAAAPATLRQLPQGRLQVCDGPGTAADGSDSGGEHDVAVMIYTSGSTGLPKGVMLTHANLDFVTRASLQQEVLLPDDVIFHALPISHSFGLVSALLCGLRAGATLRLVSRFTAPALADAITKGTITAFQGVPAMYARLHEWCQQQGRTLVPNRLRMIYIGGSLIDATRKAQTESLLGLRLHHGYGLTESAPAATRTIGHAPPRDITAGWPIPGIEVEVQDAAGRALAAGSRGEVCIRGPNVMKGYFRDPVQTRAAIDERGWLHTGDIGVFGPDGDLSIAGRSKEMIIRGGFNVYPAEIERALAEFPGVAQCAVVGRSVPGDEEVVAYLEPVAGLTVDTLALKAFLRERLAPYKVPTAIISLAQLPATSTGKLLKARLKEMANTEVPEVPVAPAVPHMAQGAQP
ncbi:class I adenylate-forming enzyme family protein [Aquabacterium sp.]|uniref:class I adenylate-forming enzyme family protein n=1 Tax=Aquabacterium sp. TaxID=1872578 RepID=UPI002BEB45ED|nr:class I adenylate-forming enzyme family protein [Aquabacterium sp.]HSW03564.1 class I adenylate-forming enzyme family protein [Aquabacterium sp.]